MKRKFTDEQLIKLHGEGLTQKEIAQQLNCSGATVCTHAKRLGLPFINMWNISRRLDIDEQLKELHALGLTIRQIAKALNCCKETVIKHAKELGLPFTRYRNRFGIVKMEGETPEQYASRYNKVWYSENPGKSAEYKKRCRQKNPEKYKAYSHDYYMRNRDKILAHKRGITAMKKALREALRELIPTYLE